MFSLRVLPVSCWTNVTAIYLEVALGVWRWREYNLEGTHQEKCAEAVKTRNKAWIVVLALSAEGLPSCP